MVAILISVWNKKSPLWPIFPKRKPSWILGWLLSFFLIYELLPGLSILQLTCLWKLVSSSMCPKTFPAFSLSRFPCRPVENTTLLLVGPVQLFNYTACPSQQPLRPPLCQAHGPPTHILLLTSSLPRYTHLLSSLLLTNTTMVCTFNLLLCFT